MQSRRVLLPRVGRSRPLHEVLDLYPRAILADPEGSPMPIGPGSTDDARPLVVVGPEGGFSPDELSGRGTVRLPGGILRTETAAIAAGVLLAIDVATVDRLV